MDIQIKNYILELFGKKLKNARVDKKLSYRELAQLCDVDHSQISKIEKGQVSIQITTLFEIAKGLEIHPKELIDFEIENPDCN